MLDLGSECGHHLECLRAGVRGDPCQLGQPGRGDPGLELDREEQARTSRREPSVPEPAATLGLHSRDGDGAFGSAGRKQELRRRGRFHV